MSLTFQRGGCSAPSSSVRHPGSTSSTLEPTRRDAPIRPDDWNGHVRDVSLSREEQAFRRKRNTHVRMLRSSRDARSPRTSRPPNSAKSAWSDRRDRGLGRGKPKHLVIGRASLEYAKQSLHSRHRSGRKVIDSAGAQPAQPKFDRHVPCIH